MSSSSVWVQLYYKGEETNDRDPFEIIPIPRDIDDLATAVYKAKDKSLGHCDAPQLVVYKCVDGKRVKLDPRDPVPTDTKENPLVVVAPDLPQHNTCTTVSC